MMLNGKHYVTVVVSAATGNIFREEGGVNGFYYTSVACNLLDVNTGRCMNYSNRFKIESDCTKLTKKNLPDFGWLPKTCAYRLLYEGKPLFDWHPLISKDPDSVKNAGMLIANGIHEKDVIDWFEFVIDEV